MTAACRRKIPYPSRAEAQRAAAQAAGQKVYSCKSCGAWHLSSKTPRQVKRERREYGT